MRRCWKRPRYCYVRIKYLGTSWVSYSMLKNATKKNSTLSVCGVVKKRKEDDKGKKEKLLSKTSNLLRLHQTGPTLLRAHAQVTEQLLPGLGSAPRMLLRNIGALLDQAGAEQLR